MSGRTARRITAPAVIRSRSSKWPTRLPAAARWSFASSDATTVAVPVLHVRGAASAPRFAEGAALVESWFPAAEHRVLDGVNHLMMAQAPQETAALLDRFWRSVR